MNYFELSPWDLRSPAVATMLNPALIATILTSAAERYESVSTKGMPWELAFIVTPLVLHRGSRESLPPTRRTHIPKWVGDNPLLLTAFPERAKAMVPHIREGIRYAVNQQTIVIENGKLFGLLPATKRPPADGDIQSIVHAAGFLGGWFTKSESTSTIYAMFGVTP